jgi:site-specific DNA-methyltransferase (adenine-specific)
MTQPYYQDEFITLYLGDCLEITDWLTADVLVTDPPYGVAWRSGAFSNAIVPVEETIKNDETAEVRDRALELWGSKPALVFGSWKIPRPRGTNNRLIWHKAANIQGMRTQPWFSADEEIYQLGTGFVGKPRQNVYVTNERRDGAHGEVARLGHPTPKPVGLLEQLISKCPDGVIADPFAGAGSTLVAAQNLRRKAIGIELEERYCETIAQRLSQVTLFGLDLASGDE